MAKDGDEASFDFAAATAMLGDVPEGLRDKLIAALKSSKPLGGKLIEKASVLTDEHNFYPFLNAETNLAYHKAVLVAKPPLFLVN